MAQHKPSDYRRRVFIPRTPPHALSEAERCIPIDLKSRVAALARLCHAAARDLATARSARNRPSVRSAFLDGQLYANQCLLSALATNLANLSDLC
jgi:hypothetical protein